ncbi:MAG: N-acetylneuraminate synthase [Nitrosomonadales bacterium]|jgi:N,N'-diacetyllegionaminate synthase|nr:N-acetylneuraminate synthase [Nitrosomonadales bacterium]
MNKTFVIAEAGVNHNGSIQIAKKLIDVAVSSGADAVKFQTFKAENLVCKGMEKADYQKKNTMNNESQFEMIKRLELDKKTHYELVKYCGEKIMFLSTPFDTESIDLLNSLEIPIFKIPSGEITNLPFLKKIAGLNKKVILSTGMSTLEEVSTAIKILLKGGLDKDDLIVLHATSEYPCPINEVNLLAMNTLGKKFNIKFGYSDHTEGIVVPISAVALGASVVEKHFTLDREMDGPDHKSSLEPDELTLMIEGIRKIEAALGDGKKTPSQSEIKNINIARKFIVASKFIKSGEVFTISNIIAKRSGKGISPINWDNVIGQKAKKDFDVDQIIEL